MKVSIKDQTARRYRLSKLKEIVLSLVLATLVLSLGSVAWAAEPCRAASRARSGDGHQGHGPDRRDLAGSEDYPDR